MPFRDHVTTSPIGRVAIVTDSPRVAYEAASGLRTSDVGAHADVLPLDDCTAAIPVGSDAELPDLVVVAAATAEGCVGCLKALRERDPRRVVPMVALCASNDPNLQACLDAGANGLLPSDAEGGVAAAVAAAASFWLVHNRLLRAHA